MFANTPWSFFTISACDIGFRMSLSPAKKCSLYALVFASLSLIIAGGLYLLMEYSGGGAVPQEQYYRAVYVLQSFGGPACLEAEQIPRRVIASDDTESLLHHPDKILVLRHIADELAKTGREQPKAAYYEACARLALGDKESAADLLTRYVIDAKYNAGYYAMLCRNLYELGDYTSLLMMCQEWQERDAACREERIRFAWSALYNLGRYQQALRHMRDEGGCLGWEAGVYVAKTALALKGEAEAELMLEHALDRYAGNTMQILRLWNILKAKNRV